MKILVRLNSLEEYPQKVPCRDACPVHTEAGNYAQSIVLGKDEEGYRWARKPNPLASVCARVCAAPCEDKCRRGVIDSPVTIRALKRFVCEKHEQTLPQECRPPGPDEIIAPLEDKVAVIGGGPAGMACADTLLNWGYRVTLFESTEMLGGALWQYIPEYRLPRSIVGLEVCGLLEKGLDLKLETALNEKLTLSSLRNEGYNAFFLACGATRALDLAIEGRDADGVFRAIDYLLNVNRGYRLDLGEKVIVIGGGNVAIDVARTALRPVEIESAKIVPPLEEGVAALSMHSATERFRDTGIFPASEEGLAGLDAARSALRGGATSVTMASLESFEQLPAARSQQGRENLTKR